MDRVWIRPSVSKFWGVGDETATHRRVRVHGRGNPNPESPIPLTYLKLNTSYIL